MQALVSEAPWDHWRCEAHETGTEPLPYKRSPVEGSACGLGKNTFSPASPLPIPLAGALSFERLRAPLVLDKAFPEGPGRMAVL